jgi:hypothetical protein
VGLRLSNLVLDVHDIAAYADRRNKLCCCVSDSFIFWSGGFGLSLAEQLGSWCRWTRRRGAWRASCSGATCPRTMQLKVAMRGRLQSCSGVARRMAAVWTAERVEMNCFEYRQFSCINMFGHVQIDLCSRCSQVGANDAQ